MTQIVTFSIVLLLAPFAGHTQETSVRKVEPFNSVSVSGPADVKLVRGSVNSVKIESTGFSSSEVKTFVAGKNLRIHLGSPVLKTRAEVNITITYVELNSINCSGACNVFSSEPLQAETLELQVNTASVIEVEVKCRSLNIDCATAGQVIVTGKSGELYIDASTSGMVDANGLIANKVIVKARTAAGVKVQAMESLEADISTASNLRYRGNPHKTNLQSSTGGGIRKAD
ncbi:MAG: head GIN domain-containing protein [Cyclobacteriaceae bacterium]